jgi:TolA-binding protein
VYTDSRVIALVESQCVPVRVHVKENRDEFQRLGSKYDANWTPTILILDGDGQERHRIEGFLPADDFLSQLALGIAKAAFSAGDYQRAERLFEEVVQKHPRTDAAPEAQYWSGVSRYKATNDPSALAGTYRKFQERYKDSTWAKKASVWGGS